MRRQMVMYKTAEAYLEALRKNLRGCDRALIQDALSDAEEHFQIAHQGLEKGEGSGTGVRSLSEIIEHYGSPEEVATAYRNLEARQALRKVPEKKSTEPKTTAGFFRVLSDPQAWGAFLYMLLGLVTGGFYGIWTLVGASLSVFSLIFIIGLPLTGLFLLSLRGIALMEGRIIEALLGGRMPRKPLFVQQELGWKGKFLALVTEPHTWRIFIYLAFQFPLGAFYAISMAVLFAFSLKAILYPLWNLGFHRSLINLNPPLCPPAWMFPLVTLAGCALLVLTLHLAKFVGKQHSRYAKYMLVRK